MRRRSPVTGVSSLSGITFFCTSRASAGDEPMARPKKARLFGVSVVTSAVRCAEPATR